MLQLIDNAPNIKLLHSRQLRATMVLARSGSACPKWGVSFRGSRADLVVGVGPTRFRRYTTCLNF